MAPWFCTRNFEQIPGGLLLVPGNGGVCLADR